MPTSSEQMRAYSGPAILSRGFRPLFLLAGVWAAISMALWVAMLSGVLELPTAFAMLDWHVHELIFGYLPAVAAGFLLTAVPNWTGRLPVTGTPLLTLAIIWSAGRIFVLTSAHSGMAVAALVDLLFLAALALVIGREIIAGRNWRNLKVLVLIGLLFSANATFHIEALWRGSAANGYGARFGIAVAVFLIIVIGGRVVPSFTRNWLARRGPGRLPVPAGRFDMGVTLAAALALVLWITFPDAGATAVACLLVGGLHVWRLARWAGERTLSEPLVLVLHVGYGFVPIGFLLVGYSVLSDYALTPSAALHAWTAGAVGVMTLAVMTRASLGHAGYPLTATIAISAIYACAIIAVVARIAVGFGLAPDVLLHVAAAGWIAAFGGFTIVFGPLLVRRGR
jgi:uncharacterized protein involved in response to NO